MTAVWKHRTALLWLLLKCDLSVCTVGLLWVHTDSYGWVSVVTIILYYVRKLRQLFLLRCGKRIYVPQRGILKLFPVLSSSGVREQPGNLNLKHQDNVGKSLLVRRDKSLTVSFVLMCGGNKICRWMVVISFSGRCLECCKMLCVPKIGLT